MVSLRAKLKNGNYLTVQTTGECVSFNQKLEHCEDWRDVELDYLLTSNQFWTHSLIEQLVEEGFIKDFDDLIRQLDEKDTSMIWCNSTESPICMVFRETVLGETIDWYSWCMYVAGYSSYEDAYGKFEVEKRY